MLFLVASPCRGKACRNYDLVQHSAAIEYHFLNFNIQPVYQIYKYMYEYAYISRHTSSTRPTPTWPQPQMRVHSSWPMPGRNPSLKSCQMTDSMSQHPEHALPRVPPATDLAAAMSTRASSKPSLARTWPGRPHEVPTVASSATSWKALSPRSKTSLGYVKATVLSRNKPYWEFGSLKRAESCWGGASSGMPASSKLGVQNRRRCAVPECLTGVSFRCRAPRTNATTVRGSRCGAGLGPSHRRPSREAVARLDASSFSSERAAHACGAAVLLGRCSEAAVLLARCSDGGRCDGGGLHAAVESDEDAHENER